MNPLDYENWLLDEQARSLLEHHFGWYEPTWEDLEEERWAHEDRLQDLSGEGIASEPRTAFGLTKGSVRESDAPSPDKNFPPVEAGAHDSLAPRTGTRMTTPSVGSRAGFHHTGPAALPSPPAGRRPGTTSDGD